MPTKAQFRQRSIGGRAGAVSRRERLGPVAYRELMNTQAEGRAERRSAHMAGGFGKSKREPSPWIEQGGSLSRRQAQRLRPVWTFEVEAPPGLLRAVIE
jgi:hypothetical protein